MPDYNTPDAHKPHDTLDRTEGFLQNFVTKIRPYAGYLLIFLLSTVAYLNTLGNEYTFDDAVIVLKNPRIRQLNRPSEIFGTSYWDSPDKGAEYRPVTILSYALNHKFNQIVYDRHRGLEPMTYHLGNVLLHALASALAAWAIFALFRRKLLAILTGLFFGLHPVHTEAVAGIVGRAELLAAVGFFTVMGACARVLYADTRRQATNWSAMAAAGMALGMFSKEHTVTVIGVVVLSGIVLWRYWKLEQHPATLGAVTRRLLPALIALMVVLGIYLLARMAVLGGLARSQAYSYGFVDNPAFGAPVMVRILTAIKTQGEYLWLLLWPKKLIADFSYDAYPLSHSLLETRVLIGLLALAGLVLAVLIGLAEGPVAAFAAGFYIITMSLTSNIPFAIGTIKAERLLYLPSLAFCLVLSLIFERLWRRHKSIEFRVIWLLVVLFVCAGYMARTIDRNPVWKNDKTLFSATVRDVPRNVKAYANLANALAAEGNFDEALKHADKALSIQVDFTYGLANRGSIRARKAEQLLRQAAQLEKQGKVNEARGLIEASQALQIRAGEDYAKTVKVDPFFVPGLYGYGVFLCLQGRFDEGLEYLRKAHALAPKSLDNLQQLVVQSWWSAPKSSNPVERLKDTVAYSRKILDINPSDYQAHVKIGEASFELGEYQAAVEALTKALSIEGLPPDANATKILASSYYHLNQLPEAEAAFENALAINPNDRAAATGLALVRQAQKTGVRKGLVTPAGAQSRPATSPAMAQ